MKQLADLIENSLSKLNSGDVVETKGASDSARCFMPDTNDFCETCGGFGWYVFNGEPRRCENYRPDRDVEKQNTLIKLSGVKDIGRKTLDNFHIQVKSNKVEYTREVHNELKLALSYAKRFAKNPVGFLVYEGSYGCGKTHLALAIASEIIHKKGMRVRFTTAADLLDNLRATFSNKSSGSNDSAQDIVESIKEIDVLILDDYGAEKSSSWAEEKLFQIINHRHANDMATVITTNLRIEDMPPRIGSRLQQADIVSYVKISAPDYRSATTSVRKDRKESPVIKYKNMTFSTWECDDEDKKDYRTFSKTVALRWAEKEPCPFLYISGEYGCGKTHLAVALAQKLYEEGAWDIEFVTLKRLSQEFHNAIGSKNTDVMDIFHQYVEAEYVFIDDYNPSSISKWSFDEVFSILDHRMSYALKTVITSNLTIEKLNKRMKSRLENDHLCYELFMRGDRA